MGENVTRIHLTIKIRDKSVVYVSTELKKELIRTDTKGIEMSLSLTPE